jgi:hypothetical protein
MLIEKRRGVKNEKEVFLVIVELFVYYNIMLILYIKRL